MKLVWLLAAGISAVAALISTADEQGRQRMSALIWPEPAPVAVADASLGRSPEVLSAEIARLENRSRLLALEKKALSIRLAMLSEDPAELTGSVSAGAARRLAAQDTTDVPPAGEHSVKARIDDLPSGGSVAEAERLGDPVVLESAVAGLPATVREPVLTDSIFSLQLGPATTVEAAREIWQRALAAAPAATEELAPLVAVDSGNPQRLWVMAGPLGDKEEAAARCDALIDAGAACKVTTRQGRPLP